MIFNFSRYKIPILKYCVCWLFYGHAHYRMRQEFVPVCLWRNVCSGVSINSCFWHLIVAYIDNIYIVSFWWCIFVYRYNSGTNVAIFLWVFLHQANIKGPPLIKHDDPRIPDCFLLSFNILSPYNSITTSWSLVMSTWAQVLL